VVYVKGSLDLVESTISAFAFSGMVVFLCRRVGELQRRAGEDVTSKYSVIAVGSGARWRVASKLRFR